MHPFFPSLPNQIQSHGSANQPVQQAMLLNPTQFPSQGLNPRFPTPPMANFNNQSSNLGNFSGNPMGMRNWPLSMPCPSLSNGTDVPPLAQNNQMGVLPLPGPFGVNQAVGTLNQVMALHLLRQQNLNFLASLQPGSTFLANNLPRNINQIVGLPNEQVHLQNLMMQRNRINALSIPPSSRPTGSNNPGFVDWQAYHPKPDAESSEWEGYATKWAPAAAGEFC
ncbi:uncharacterized protein LOC120110284 isoform X2 [Phoenix dactylifera]|uniref:Uncharacterized protein LOC120110284 isoform X2 n=1 Tax=Phoenix dactylifera TaxID=42345 RepID=A0A8B9AA23_PHODC|nr:uncharacterized protein LOC120110284 isoform X2 [Phoenix dactylifera]